MIVRNVNNVIYIIKDTVGDEETFMDRNPNSGFMKVDNVPYSRYGNYKLEDGNIVVDEDKEHAESLLQYKIDRGYPSIGDQLDMLWHAIDTGTLDKTSDFYISLKAVKDTYPKPE